MSTPHPLRVVLAPNPSPMTLDGTRTYIVGMASPVVIDPGPDDRKHVESVLAALGAAVPVSIVLTHEHADHAGATRTLAAATGAPVRVAPGALRPTRADAWGIADGEAIETDGGVLRAVATPGHAPEHIALHWTGGGAPPGGALFVGDLMMGIGNTTLVAPPEGDLAAYLGSLDRVESLRPEIVYPAHGPPIDDPAVAVERYRAHRRERVDQLRGLLARRPAADAAALVDEIYGPALDPALRSQAAGSVAAMLRYLDRSGGNA